LAGGRDGELDVRSDRTWENIRSFDAATTATQAAEEKTRLVAN
jgi:hypothetical protein